MKARFTSLRQRAGLTIEQAADLTGYTPRTVYRWENGETVPRKAVIETLTRLCEDQAAYGVVMQSGVSFIDLFAGIGGMRLGFESAGGKCVFTSEYNPFSVKTYRCNFPQEHMFAGDLTEVHETSIPAHDILVAGFPCQPFSIAGVSKKNALGRPHGFACEAQGTLFFDVARILKHHRPPAFLLENVKNLIGHDRGRTFEVIRRTLEEELGYHIQWRVVDAKPFVPQHRERIFIVGFREQTGFDFRDLSFPPEHKWPKLSAIFHPEDGSEEEEFPYTTGRMAKVADRYTLTENLWNYLQAYAEKHRRKGNGFGFGLVGPGDTARTLSARYHKDGSEILIRQGGGKRPRRLTPRECARLMGFDSLGRPNFKIPVSDTQAYRQFGNAVVVPVVSAIAKLMMPHVISLKEGKPTEPRERDLFTTSEAEASYG
ncbi:MAG: (cytosine-5)-methyltransferase 1 [Candidatus Sumerlaeota bacterium]|nr:(cytosine-5)-methyltransferase 1 [Candidatus Sumerlaeota bacterium]